MTAQLAPPSAPAKVTPELESWQQQIVLRENVARKALRPIKGIVSTQPILEYMQGRAFAENRLALTIASTADSAPDSSAPQVLTLT